MNINKRPKQMETIPRPKWAALLLMFLGPFATAQAPWVTPALRAPHVHFETFFSDAVGQCVSYHMYLPSAYARRPTWRFPVIYWLHGSGSATNGVAQVSRWFHDAIEQGLIPPLIVVFPNGLSFGMWCDARDGRAPVETMLIHELIPYVDATYRTIATRAGRMIEGFSMGGYGAGRLGFKHHRLFAAASLLGAGPVQVDFLSAPHGSRTPLPQRLRIYQAVWSGDPASFFAQSPWRLAEEHAADMIASGLRVRQVVGTRDFLFADNTRLHAHLTSLKIPVDFTAVAGIDHDAPALLRALGAKNWEFYRATFGPDEETHDGAAAR